MHCMRWVVVGREWICPFRIGKRKATAHSRTPFHGGPPPNIWAVNFHFCFVLWISFRSYITSRMLYRKEKRKWKFTAQILGGGSSMKRGPWTGAWKLPTRKTYSTESKIVVKYPSIGRSSFRKRIWDILIISGLDWDWDWYSDRYYWDWDFGRSQIIIIINMLMPALMTVLHI
jgi:hypothetical protein